MVIIMESRVERYKREKSYKKSRHKHSIVFFLSVIVLIASLSLVDNSFRTLLCLENISILEYSYNDELHKLHLFGENYQLEQKKIENALHKVMEKGKNMMSALEN